MQKNRILILFAHPLFEKSNANKALVNHIPNSEHITFHDLYEEYPQFDIDIKREQELLAQHDIIIWHHPIYWYSCPPLLKQWIDMVLEHSWAYGKKGNALKDKILFQVITTGGPRENYCREGKDRFSIPELLEPFNQTAQVCKMNYLPPFVVHGTHEMDDKGYKENGLLYQQLLTFLIDTAPSTEIHDHYYLNDWFSTLKTDTNGQ
ncbi:NAD(P)H-dependent oxidoreductase [Flavobacterium sp. '19STA2R22 D10 B1']|uniref:NAD(P)H-dependent oxidoreductase n=1 Tax=Flavobacterium aerium TaxID=3037261 RepID=UPI00278BCF76|nr:NAD(P)H-dependent oxidoreductase [Flavobacterium sp. '19STA2R22 D10 B1']